LKALGLVLYTRYASCFVLAGIILFVSMVGAIMLTASEPTVYPRHQDIYAQVQRTPQNAVFLMTKTPWTKPIEEEIIMDLRADDLRRAYKEFQENYLSNLK
jgi:hypothetical protein